MNLSFIDIAIVAIYAISIFAAAQWFSRKKTHEAINSSDFFLAGRSLPWWAIGTSLIAANISAEQIIGMSGSAYKMGIAIASYEWMSAITLLLVGKFLLPIFLKKQIYTMPQYLEQRYDSRVRMVMAVFWLIVFVFVNLTSILWLGANTINSLVGIDVTAALIVLGAFTAAYSLYGGLKAVAMTDFIQVGLLILGGLLVTGLALSQIGGHHGLITGFATLMEKAPEKFDLILSKDNQYYSLLPGISVLIGGMWIMNISYWGFNQYIIQRALAAKNIGEAQKGIVLAAFLKLLMPVIVVLPGVAAFVMLPDLAKPDQAYPEMMKLLPTGIKGIVFAALIAAIVASLASKVNSVATIFVIDIYKHIKTADKTDAHLLKVGRIVSLIALAIAIAVAKPLLGSFDQAFQYIQEFTGFFTPGIVVIFLFGMFWRRTTAAAALGASVGSVVTSLVFKLAWPSLPFMDRVGVVFLICSGVAVLVTLLDSKSAAMPSLNLREVDFSTKSSYAVLSAVVCLILTVLYVTWW